MPKPKKNTAERRRLALSALAMLVWGAVGTVFWRRRSSQGRPERQGRQGESPRGPS